MGGPVVGVTFDLGWVDGGDAAIHVSIVADPDGTARVYLAATDGRKAVGVALGSYGWARFKARIADVDAAIEKAKLRLKTAVDR